MSDCDQCQNYIGPSGGVHHGCGHEEVPTVVFLACMTGANCEHWYPNGREYLHCEEGEWMHICQPGDDAQVGRAFWDTTQWVLDATGNLHAVAISFCPFCGLELLPMPEVKE